LLIYVKLKKLFDKKSSSLEMSQNKMPSVVAASWLDCSVPIPTI